MRVKTTREAAFSVVFAIMLIFSAGCANNSPLQAKEENGPHKLSVIATIFAPYDFARQIGGDLCDVEMLLPPASESHSFEPTPKDILKIQNCDIFIYVGGESDEWVKGILSSIPNQNRKDITLMDCVAPVEEELLEGMEDEAEPEGGGVEYDEHVWTSPRNARLIAAKISEAIQSSDPENAPMYQANTDKFIFELDELDKGFRDAVAGGSRKTLIFGDRFPFRYLADAYGLKCYAAFKGCSTESEASVATIKFLVEKTKAENIPVIFYIELSDKKIAETIAFETGAKTALLHACHNISRDDFRSGATYISLMRQNIDNIREALK